MTQALWMKRALFIVVGGAAGFAYYYFVGCTTGSCPISSNPYISTAYGAVVGAVLMIGNKSNKG